MSAEIVSVFVFSEVLTAWLFFPHYLIPGRCTSGRNTVSYMNDLPLSKLATYVLSNIIIKTERIIGLSVTGNHLRSLVRGWQLLL